MSIIHLGGNKSFIDGTYGKIPVGSWEAEKEIFTVFINTILFESLFLNYKHIFIIIKMKVI